MAEAENGQEKTEEPTLKRLNDAREEGKVARSKELSTMLLVATGCLGMLLLGPSLLNDIANITRKIFSLSRDRLLQTTTITDIFLFAISESLFALLPILALMTVAAILAPLALSGWVFSTKALMFKAERIDPLKGLKRVFGVQGLVELLKALAKFLLLALVASIFLMFSFKSIMGLSGESILAAMSHSAILILWSALALCLALLLVAGIDVPYQIWHHAKNLRMSRQEVKDEMKQTEGDPELKGRIKAVQREISRRRMMEAVPEADVVLINPTHFSVALKYDGRRANAPRVIAKGTDEVALKIREIAAHHKVHIYSEPMLTRAIYFSTKLDQEIPAALYLAVAQILAYVYQLDRAQSNGTQVPDKPIDLEVPDEYQKLANRKLTQ